METPPPSLIIFVPGRETEAMLAVPVLQRVEAGIRLKIISWDEVQSGSPPDEPVDAAYFWTSGDAVSQANVTSCMDWLGEAGENCAAIALPKKKSVKTGQSLAGLMKKGVAIDADAGEMPEALPQDFDEIAVLDSYGNQEEARRQTLASLADTNDHFSVLGSTGSHVFLFLKEKSTIFSYPVISAYKNPVPYLLVLAPMQYWQNHFGVDDLNSARIKTPAQELLQSIAVLAVRCGYFDPDTAQRGLGVHKIGGKIIVHLGNGLLIDGQNEGLGKIDGSFFTSNRTLPIAERDATNETLEEWTRAIQAYRFEKSSDAKLFLGWMICALIAGALAYRPHAWVSGKAGSGKTWLVDKVVAPLMADGWGEMLSARLTAAALARVCGDSLPIVIDEAEATGRREVVMQDLFELMRTASASGEGTGFTIKAGKGTRDVIKTQPRCCFMLLSISLSALNDAERSRISTIKLADKGVADWDMVSGDLMRIMKQADQIRTRIVRSAASIIRTISTAYEALAPIFERREERQQLHYAALFGAAIWATEGGREPASDDPQWGEFQAMIEAIFKRDEDRNLQPDNERIIDAILSLRIAPSRGEFRAISELQVSDQYAHETSDALVGFKNLRDEANRHGIDVFQENKLWFLLVNPQNNNLRSLLKHNYENAPSNLTSLLETTPRAKWVAVPRERSGRSNLRRLGVRKGAKTPLLLIPLDDPENKD